jgi:hypothetical protein
MAAPISNKNGRWIERIFLLFISIVLGLVILRSFSGIAT